MRTTLTLDDDIAISSKNISRKLDLPYRQVINKALRLGLKALSKKPQTKKYKTHPKPLKMRPSYSIDNIQELLSRLDGEESK